MIGKFLSFKTKTVGRAAFLLAVFSLLSKVLGLLRDNLLANLFPKEITDAYFAAFRIPDFVYAIVIGGGVTAAFLPVFAESFKKSRKDAQKLSGSIFVFFSVFLFFISILLFIFAGPLVKIIAPGFSASQHTLTVSLTRLMFLSPIFLGLSVILTSVLQFFNIFLATALAPLFYNLGIIFGILFFAPVFGPRGLAFGVILGAFLHLFIQIFPFVKLGFSFKPNFDLRIPGLKKFFLLIGPRIISSATSQLNLIVLTAIASTLPSGALSIFVFSDNIQSIPTGLIGIPFATAIFPLLSWLSAKGDKESFSQNFSAVFCYLLFLIVPLSVFFFLLRAQIVRLILGTSFVGEGLFGWEQTRLVAASLGIFSFSLFAVSLIPFLTKVFFSRHNTVIPLKITFVAVVFNIILCFLLTRLLSFPNFFRQAVSAFFKLKGISGITVLGLPLAVSISTIFQFFLLLIWLKKEAGDLNYRFIWSCFKKIAAAAFLMFVFVFVSLKGFAALFSLKTVVGVFFQTALSGIVAVVSYLYFCRLLGLREAEALISLIRKIKKIKLNLSHFPFS